MKEWLEELKPGDKVIVATYPNQKQIRTVERTTRTQIIVHGFGKFRKDGTQINPSKWRRSTLLQATEEDMKQIEAEHERGLLMANVRRKVDTLLSQMDKTSTEKLERILKALDS